MCMVVIYKNTQNTVTLTLTEKMVDPGNGFVFTLTHDASGVEKAFQAADVSTATDRYNRFVWEEVLAEDEDTGAGLVNLEVGTHTYRAYEDPEGTLLETGRAVVLDTPAADAYFDVDPGESTNQFYN